MESSRPATGVNGKTAGNRSKTPGIPTSTRLQRNLAEKERRDKLNGFISELATLVPMVSNASKPLDKVSILRLAAAEMRLHFSCLNPKKYKKKPLALPPAIMASLDLIEKTVGGFIIVTTLAGLIVFCSRSIEDYLGYQNIDVMGNRILKYIYEDDIKYFESKVTSVVNSLKKANKKKTKVIKAHMLQKPLPRSSETCRPRNMIFKISIHQNDTNNNGSINGSSNHSPNTPKSRFQKDFGYSAVVLMFIEPVRLEPEIDITYIDSNQDVYFTRHGLQGEIIYADQRISTITGYMPHDVQGTSAYQYICSSDVPIALFAQKAMFTSTDGKGVIVYRLRIRDMRCIYLQSSGQIAYKESSNEISHFVCFNRLLSEEEGSQELKKFQQRYAPQIMAAKMIQVKQNPGSRSPTTDLAYQQVMTLMNSSSTKDTPSSSAVTNSFPYSKIPSPEFCSGTIDKKPSETLPSSSFSTELNFMHSSEGHSTTNPIHSDSTNTITLDCSPVNIEKEQLDIILDKPEQRLGGGPFRRTNCSSTFHTSPYETVINGRKGDNLPAEQFGIHTGKVEPELNDAKMCYSVNTLNTNGSNQIQLNGKNIDVKYQNKTALFVNANNNFYNGIDLNKSGEIYNDHSMDFNGSLPDNIFQLTASQLTAADESNGLINELNRPREEYVTSKEPIAGNNFHMSSINVLPNVVYDQVNLDEESMPVSGQFQFEDAPNLSRMLDVSSLSSLLKNPNYQSSITSDLYNGVNYCQSFSSHSKIDDCSDYNTPSSISSYRNGANISVQNDLDMLNYTIFSESQTDGFHASSLNGLKTVSPMETLNLLNTSKEITSLGHFPQDTERNNVDFMDTNVNGIISAKTKPTEVQSSSSSVVRRGLVETLDLNEILSHPAPNEDISLNEELYSELDLFFRTSPPFSTSPTSSVMNGVSGFSIDNNSYLQGSISSETKTIYHQ